MKIYRDLLFLHGHIADPVLAASLATDDSRDAAPAFRSPAMDLFKSLMYLGGRPMHSGRNYDLDEPFETFGNHVANERLFGKPLPASNAPREVRPVPAAQGLAAQGCG